MLLSDLKKGEIGIIKEIRNGSKVKKRFADLGVLRGEKLIVDKIAPLGDPVEILVKGYRLSLRKNEACEIEVKKEEK